MSFYAFPNDFQVIPEESKNIRNWKTSVMFFMFLVAKGYLHMHNFIFTNLNMENIKARGRIRNMLLAF